MTETVFIVAEVQYVLRSIWHTQKQDNANGENAQIMFFTKRGLTFVGFKCSLQSVDKDMSSSFMYHDWLALVNLANGINTSV